jgi:hypothetical protein
MFMPQTTGFLADTAHAGKLRVSTLAGLRKKLIELAV